MNPRQIKEIEALAARSEELFQAGRLSEAEAACRKLAGLLPDHAMVHYNLARILKDRGKTEAAATALRKALALAPGLAEGWLNLGNLLGEAGQWAAAGEAFARGLAVRPGFWPMMSGLARVKVALGRWPEAEAILRQALAQAPDAPQVLLNLANVVLEHGSLAEAVALYDRALTLAPGMAELLMGAGHAARKAGDLGRALEFYERAASARPDDLAIRARLAEARFAVCDWRGIDSLMTDVVEPCLRSGKGEIGPLMAVTFPVALGAERLAAFARQKAEAVAAKVTPLKPVRPDRGGGRIRLGYLSADMRRHPVAYLVADLFERHDRDRFEVFVYSYGPDDESPTRARLERGVDHFVDVKDLPPAEAAARIRADGIHILVDLTLYTQFSRPEICAFRPAPIQVNWLGFAGTSGAPWMDYILADPAIAPLAEQPYFTERIVQLPDSYLPFDPMRERPQRIPGRAESGLPESGFVFCAFHNAYKINPPVFDVWMRLLAGVPGSVLWLLEGNAAATANLRREAEIRGIDPARLVFAPRVDVTTYLARHALADLFLDVIPYNAHGSAADALWMGLPLITCTGTSFAGRVATGVLRAVGLPELVTADLAQYEALALALAHDPGRLAGLRGRLEAERGTAPLFDNARFTAHLEAALTRMWDTWRAGRKAQSFAV